MSIELIVFALCVFAICMIGILGCISTLEEVEYRNYKARYKDELYK